MDGVRVVLNVRQLSFSSSPLSPQSLAPSSHHDRTRTLDCLSAPVPGTRRRFATSSSIGRRLRASCARSCVVDEESTGPQPARTLGQNWTNGSHGGRQVDRVPRQRGAWMIEGPVETSTASSMLVTTPITAVPILPIWQSFAGRRRLFSEVAVDGMLGKQYVWQHMPIMPMPVGAGCGGLDVLQAVSHRRKSAELDAPKAQPSEPASASGSKGSSNLLRHHRQQIRNGTSRDELTGPSPRQ